MKLKNKDLTRRLILKGLRDGLPIGLGYFAVAFSLGITARGAGVSPLQGWVASILNHASAGTDWTSILHRWLMSRLTTHCIQYRRWITTSSVSA